MAETGKNSAGEVAAPAGAVTFFFFPRFPFVDIPPRKDSLLLLISHNSKNLAVKTAGFPKNNQKNP